MIGEQRTEGMVHTLDDVDLFAMQEDPQDVRPWHTRDAAVTEIHAEQVRVFGLVLVVGVEPTLNRF